MGKDSQFYETMNFGKCPYPKIKHLTFEFIFGIIFPNTTQVYIYRIGVSCTLLEMSWINLQHAPSSFTGAGFTFIAFSLEDGANGDDVRKQK